MALDSLQGNHAVLWKWETVKGTIAGTKGKAGQFEPALMERVVQGAQL